MARLLPVQLLPKALAIEIPREVEPTWLLSPLPGPAVQRQVAIVGSDGPIVQNGNRGVRQAVKA